MNLPASEQGSRSPALDPIARRPRRSHVARALSEKIQTGAYWVLALGVLHLLFGGLSLVLQLRTNPPAFDHGRSAPPEWRLWVGSASLLMVGVAYVAMYQWTKRSPVPALRAALGLYLATYLISGLIDPSNLLNGLIGKAIVTALLGRALMSATAQRARARRSGIEEPQSKPS